MSATKVNMLRRSRYSLHTLSGKVLVLISCGVRAYADIVMAAMAIIAKLSSRGALVLTPSLLLVSLHRPER